MELLHEYSHFNELKSVRKKYILKTTEAKFFDNIHKS